MAQSVQSLPVGWTTKFRFTARTGNFVFLHSVQIGFKISHLPIQKLSPLKCLECKKTADLFFIFLRNSPPVDQGLFIHEVSRSHIDAPQSEGLPWTSDQFVAKTSTWQHTTLTTDRQCPR